MNLPGALRRRGEENAGRRSHPERCRMMLGDVIAEKPRCIVFTQQLKAPLIQIIQAVAAPLDMIEHSELYPIHFFHQPSMRRRSFVAALPL
jgi:hypothetical protein